MHRSRSWHGFIKRGDRIVAHAYALKEADVREVLADMIRDKRASECVTVEVRPMR